MSETVDGPLPVAAETLALERLRADLCIKNHVIAAMGVGLVPSFLVELAGVTGIEVKMIRDLARIYAFPVPSKLIAYKVLISLVASIAPLYLAARMQSAVKGLPVVGHAAYVGFLSASSGAAVYAVGKIFQKHYESGGTFLGSGKPALNSYYKQQLEDGKKLAAVHAA